jgi:hypothetical protein
MRGRGVSADHHIDSSTTLLRIVTAAVWLSATLFSVRMSAQPAPRQGDGTDASAKKKKEAEKKEKKRWSYKVKAGLNTSLVHNKNVPGIDDGLNATIGALVESEVTYEIAPHTWGARLKIVHTRAKTPTLDPFIKTADELNLKTFYKYDLGVWDKLSLIGSVQLITALFPGNLVYADSTTLIKNNLDGSTIFVQAFPHEPYEITPAFSPTLLKQAVGVTAQPATDPVASLDLTVTMAGLEVWARGYTVDDDGDTPEIELTELQSYQQVGPQLEAVLAGKIKEKLSYSFAAELMFPVYTSVDTELSGFNLMNADITFELSVEIKKWASLSYAFSAKRNPILLDEWQILNNLVLSLTASVMD